VGILDDLMAGREGEREKFIGIMGTFVYDGAGLMRASYMLMLEGLYDARKRCWESNDCMTITSSGFFFFCLLQDTAMPISLNMRGTSVVLNQCHSSIHHS
jgi:hypothetical protein